MELMQCICVHRSLTLVSNLCSSSLRDCFVFSSRRPWLLILVSSLCSSSLRRYCSVFFVATIMVVTEISSSRFRVSYKRR